MDRFRENRKTVIVSAVAALVVIAAVGYVFSLNGNSFNFSDTEIRIVVSGSMDGEPRDQYEIETIPTGSAVFISEVPDSENEKKEFYSHLQVGDVLTFNYMNPVSKENMVVTHRIIDIKESNGIYTYTLAGDSIRDDPTNSSTQIVTSDSGDVIGKVTGVSHILGIIITFLSTWYGKVIVIIIPCVLLIISESRNIYNILKGNRESSEFSELSESQESDDSTESTESSDAGSESEFKSESESQSNNEQEVIQ